MWIFCNDSFLSIVDKAENVGCLVVRARRDGDIELLFPEAEVLKSAGTDYKFRAEIPRARVASVLAAKVKEIDYANFKNSVEDPSRHRAYAEVWRTMERFQAGLR